MTEDNLDVIRQGYEAFGRGDINALLESFDEQIQWITPGPPELATSGNRTGR
jgi:ketosteroid isomerase-like protein